MGVSHVYTGSQSKAAEVSQIHYAIKSCKKYHSERLPVLRNTWLKQAANYAIYSDVEGTSMTGSCSCSFHSALRYREQSRYIFFIIKWLLCSSYAFSYQTRTCEKLWLVDQLLIFCFCRLIIWHCVPWSAQHWARALWQDPGHHPSRGPAGWDAVAGHSRWWHTHQVDLSSLLATMLPASFIF